MTLAKYLKQRSKEICRDNECTDDNHNCESYAYIDKQGNLLDICACDYFQGSSKPNAAIPLPWSGSQDAEEEHEEIEADYLQSILEDYRIMLKQEYEYQTTEEAIISTIEANDYEFTKDGKLTR